MGYIEKNMALALDVVTYIDLLLLNLSTKLQINLLTLDNTECYNIVHEGDDRDIVVGSLRKKQKREQTLARDILKEVTGCAYNRLRARLINEIFIDESILPSLYHLTKYQPKIDSWTYFGSTDTGSTDTGSTTAGTAATTTTNTVGPTHTDNSSTTPPTVGTTITTVAVIDTLKQIDDIISTVRITKNNDDVKQVAKILGENKGYSVAKIEQGYEHYVNIMIDKFLWMG